MKERINKQINNNNNNNIIIQITLFSTTGKYKPISTLLEVESVAWYKEHAKECKEKAIRKICLQRDWTIRDLLYYGYTSLKVRNYTLWKKMIEQKKGIVK